MDRWPRYVRVGWEVFGRSPVERLMVRTGLAARQFLAAFERSQKVAPREVARNERAAEAYAKRKAEAAAVGQQFDGPFQAQVLDILERFKRDCGERGALLRFEMVTVKNPAAENDEFVRIETWLGDTLIATVLAGVDPDGKGVGASYNDDRLADWIGIKWGGREPVRTPSSKLLDFARYVAHALHGISVSPRRDFGITDAQRLARGAKA